MNLRAKHECRYFYLIGDDDSKPDSFLVAFFGLEPYETHELKNITAFEDPVNVYVEATYLLTKAELQQLLSKGNLNFEKPSRAFLNTPL